LIINIIKWVSDGLEYSWTRALCCRLRMSNSCWPIVERAHCHWTTVAAADNICVQTMSLAAIANLRWKLRLCLFVLAVKREEKNGDWLSFLVWLRLSPFIVMTMSASDEKKKTKKNEIVSTV
jgi:hypothetical protein